MTARKKLVIVNGSALVGIFISLFIITPRTPLWMWASISMIVTGLLNYVAVIRAPKLDETGQKNSTWSTAAIVFGFELLMLELALRFLHH